MSAPSPSLPPRESQPANPYQRDPPSSSTWVRPDIQKERPREKCKDPQEAATWQNGGCKARQVSGWPNRNGKQNEQPEQPPFWIVSVVSKTASAEGSQFAAEAVVLPRVLRLATCPSGSPAPVPGGNVGQILGGGFKVPQTGITKPNPPKSPVRSPRSALVKSYYQAVAIKTRPTFGPPWLVEPAKCSRDPPNAPAADTCLFMPAWERSNKVSNRVSSQAISGFGVLPINGTSMPSIATVSTCGFDSSVAQKDGAALGRVSGANPLVKGANLSEGERMKLDEIASESPQMNGLCPDRPNAKSELKVDSRNGYRVPGSKPRAVFGSAALARMSVGHPGGQPRADWVRPAAAQTTPESDPRALRGAATAVHTTPESKSRPVCGVAAGVHTIPDAAARAVQVGAAAFYTSPESNPRAVCSVATAIHPTPEVNSRAVRGAVQITPGCRPRAVVGAARTALKLSDGIAKQAKRPRWSEAPVNKPELVNCSVYWQNIGADEKSERGPRMSATLEKLELPNPGANPCGNPGGIYGDNLAVNGGVNGTRNELPGEWPRVMLVFGGSAALLYDVIHVAESYLIPAPQASFTAVDTVSKTAPGPLPAANYACSRLPVIDLTDGESVHSCQLVSVEPAADSKQPERGLAADSGKRVQAKLVLELPELVYREALSFLNARTAQRAGKPASWAGGSAAATEGVVLRGRVVGVLELQLAWGCPFCGASAAASEADAAAPRTLRMGCARCCADASMYTVLVRKACFAFDDGASQCEVWAEGLTAADLLTLPYTAAESPPTEPLARHPAAIRPPEFFEPVLQAKTEPSNLRTAGSAKPNSEQARLIQDSSSGLLNDKLGLGSNPSAAAGLGNPVGLGDFETCARKNSLSLPSGVSLHSGLLPDGGVKRPNGAESPALMKNVKMLNTDSSNEPREASVKTAKTPQVAVSHSRCESPVETVKRLHVGDSHAARDALVESVKRRQRAGNSKAAQYEPDALFRNLHRCLIDSSKLEALVRREGLVRVKTNATGAADGSFLAAQLEMSGAGGRPLPGPDREGLEVLVARACRQGQQMLTCVSLPHAATDRSRFLTKEQSAASSRGRCRVYLSGQVYEIHAPVVARYRVLKTEAVAYSAQAALLCGLLSESDSDTGRV